MKQLKMPVETYDRVTGYFRPTFTMNKGKRVKRGLFKSKDGILINSDVNGAINIARKSKVTGMREIANSLKGIVAFPKRIRIANE
jgi:transposase